MRFIFYLFCEMYLHNLKICAILYPNILILESEVPSLERLQLLWVSQSYTRPNAGVKAHSHPYYHMFYISDGFCQFVVDGIPYDIHAGTCLLVPRQVDHGFCNTSGAQVEHMEIKFSLPQTAMDNQLLQAGVLISDNPLVTMLIKQIIKEYAEIGSLADDSAASYLTALLNILTESGRYQKPHHFRYIDASAFSTLSQRIIAYLETHFAQDVSLDELAQELDYNKSYLCIAFKKDTHMTILDCLNTIRIRRAAEMIVYSDHSLLQVAEQCGFASVSHFNRVFQKYVGITPGQCRRAYPVDILFKDPKDAVGFPDSPNRFVYSVLARKRVTREEIRESNRKKE